MRLAITARHLPLTSALEELARRRAGFALGRFAQRLAEVRFRLAGEGPMVGCLATARVLPGQVLAVHGTYESPQAAIADLCERLRERVMRALERRQQRGRS